jgi:hypothetical protein
MIRNISISRHAAGELEKLCLVGVTKQGMGFTLAVKDVKSCVICLFRFHGRAFFPLLSCRI